MSLYFKFCGLRTTKTPSGAGEAGLLPVEMLRRFINAGKRFDGQRKLNGMPNEDYCFKDKRQNRPWLNFLRITVPTVFCHNSKTIAGGHNFVRQKCALFPEGSTSKSFPSSVAEVFGKIRGIFCLSEAVVSVYTVKANAFRICSATCGESIFSRYISQIIKASSLRGRLPVLTSVFRPLGRFATFPQSHFKPSIALCAVSQ